MIMLHSPIPIKADPMIFEAAADRAARAIPPVWPLMSSVAVNPFLGQAGETLAKAGARLARVAGIAITMPRHWYQQKIDTGEISDADLLAALACAPADPRPTDLAALKAAAALNPPRPQALASVADLAAQASGVDWPGLTAERLGAWMAGYFDEGQALWAAPRGKSAYGAWRAVATHDLTPEIAGLRGFARHVSDAPETAMAVIARVCIRLGLPAEALETYFHQMLMSLGGWGQYARYKLWQAELAGGSDQTITDLLAIRLIWEEALFLRYGDQIGEAWAHVRVAHAAPVVATPDLMIDAILQDAAERAAHRELARTLIQAQAKTAPQIHETRPLVQAAFCIDVRSEVFRRALESLNPQIQTLGFAGFFGLAASHRRFASDVAESRFPVLLNPALKSRAGGPYRAEDAEPQRVKARAKRAWGRFKLAAVSSFAFVEATGPIYVGKLLSDALGLPHASAPNDPAPQLDPALDLASRVKAAGAVLRAMSLTTGFARLVLLAGHGANTVNNPHASGLHCGACGGYSGEVNARLLAALLNDPEVRAGLTEIGIEIPQDTLFLAALHDTTTDRVTLYADDHPCQTHEADITQARTWLADAGKLARGERALRLPRAADEASLSKRSRDWSETRPEWALAGCKTFIAAPRSRTATKNLEGRAFLHDYDWKQDKDFSTLELILTAPVIVASWISLQYYGSTVAPEAFGGGNKLLHNVTGGIGVVEGNGGLLRAGLPWQSVHDGQNYMHEPLRLSVCLEAPVKAITEILDRHEGVRTLFDNGWLHLFTLNEEGSMAWRYNGGLQWVPMDDTEDAEQRPKFKVAV
ncbi:YbcC family protein [Agrobacterium vitis]|uniref:YbcC family protein n=1 Tax=Agrobacterium vitis TaxID=373 RepID=UPI003908A549